MGSVLYAKEIPETGGDTMFANFTGEISDATAILDGRRVYPPKRRSCRPSEEWTKTERRVDVQTELFIRRPNSPETGRKALYVNRGHTVCFKDFTRGKRLYSRVSFRTPNPPAMSV